jgi:2-hydroxychromene-2-carboxylate isomerase
MRPATAGGMRPADRDVGANMATDPLPGARIPVDFWFDPICPWAWVTSRWVLEAAAVRPLDIRWHVISLGILNEDLDHPAPRTGWSWKSVRVITAAQHKYGDEIVLPLYTALGNRLHLQVSPRDLSTIEAALVEVGLPAELAQAALSDEYDEALQASHDAGVERSGPDLGVPVIAVGDQAFFGPIIAEAPKGEAAGRLWDLTWELAELGVYELKRTRARPLSFG